MLLIQAAVKNQIARVLNDKSNKTTFAKRKYFQILVIRFILLRFYILKLLK